MEEWLSELAYFVGLAIEFVAIVAIAVGTLETLVAIARHLFGPQRKDDTRHIWLRYARWLVAGLTFQLAADIVHTSVAPTWDDVGRVGVIAVIRTFLTFFLDRDVDRARVEVRENDWSGVGERE